ncbi:MAG: tRNA (adenine(22)-N(1))-methyltransferase [Bacillota bacterium]
MTSVAELVIAGEPVADIGSDHALLACYLVGEGRCPRAICGELRDGPYRRTLEAVRMNGLEHLIEVRQGNGLEVLALGEVSTVVLAGLGGNTIVSILNRSPGKTQSFKRLVLQPMNALAEIRQLAGINGWRIERETVVRDGDYYVNLVLDPRHTQPYTLSATELRWGPLLMQNTAEPVVRDYYNFQLNKLKGIIAGITDQSTRRSLLQRQVYEERKKELEDVLK